MDFRFSEEEERFRRDVKEFLARELPPGWVGFRGLGERGETPEEIAFFKEMANKLGRSFVSDHEAAMVKVFGSELWQRMAQVGIELLGPYGMLEKGSKWAPLEGWLHHLYLRSVSNTIEMGTSEVQRNIVALRGLGLPR